MDAAAQDGRAPPFSAREEFDTNYVDDSHMVVFAEALAADDYNADQDESGAVSPPAAATSGFHPQSKRVRKVSALSDWAPIDQRVTRRRATNTNTNANTKRRGHHRRTEWTYLLTRWPLLIFIWSFISFQFGLYVLIRQLVNGKEWLYAWRGKKGRLRAKMREAKTYKDWEDCAHELDGYLDFDEWKATDEDPYYDWRLVRKVRKSLKSMRERNDIRGVVGVLETCLRANFAGIESARLYSETYYGTKKSIEDYITELERAIEYVRESTELSTDEKRRFFKSSNTNFGTSALCLSGGAAFGYYHFGVVKAFLEADLLPRVVTGTSAGGVVAALMCTRTDAELRALLVPELACRITAFSEPLSVWGRRAWRTGARFDGVQWAERCSWFCRGSMTFREAYERTGRILNISVTPADRHSPTKLLNYLTSPNTVIWSALLASAAVPGILNPVVLMQKLKDGCITPWNWGSKFKDGSLRVDIPLQALNLYFNVTHPVVSQVNPHVHLFFFAPRGSAGKPVAHRKGTGWRGNFLLSAAEAWLKLELTKNFKVIRDLELLPQLLGQDWSSVFLQRFDGAVTIWPRTRILDWLHILTDPDGPELERMIMIGQRATWPKLHMIDNRFRLEKQILLGRQAVRRLLRSHPPSRPLSRNAEEEPVTGTNLPSGGALEQPMSMDTDAEAAFAKGAEYFFKHRSRFASPRPDTPPSGAFASAKDDGQSRRELRRRKALSSLFEESPTPAKRSLTPDPPPPRSASGTPEAAPEPQSPGTFFRQLRSGSFAGFSSPFASMRRGATPVGAGAPVPRIRVEAEDDHDTWSSESSSDDALDPRDVLLRSNSNFGPSLSRGRSVFEQDEPDVDV